LKSVMVTLLWVILIGDALLLVMIVLLQSGRGGGLSGMLGGGGAAESALGPKSGLPKITGAMAAILFVSAILMGILSRDDSAFKPEEAEGTTPTTATAAEPDARPSTASDADKPTTAADAAKPSTGTVPQPTKPTTGEAAEPGKKAATSAAGSTAKPAR